MTASLTNGLNENTAKDRKEALLKEFEELQKTSHETKRKLFLLLEALAFEYQVEITSPYGHYYWSVKTEQPTEETAELVELLHNVEEVSWYLRIRQTEITFYPNSNAKLGVYKPNEN